MNKQILTKQVRPTTAMAKAKRLFELKALIKEIKPEIDQLNAELLEVMQNNDTYTLKTGTYTLSRGKRITPQIEDFEALKKALDARQIPYQTVEAFSVNMKPVFQTLIENKDELEGLTGLETEYISIRLAKKEKNDER